MKKSKNDLPEVIFVVTIVGPDSRQALAELISNSEYDKLNVKISVNKVNKQND